MRNNELYGRIILKFGNVDSFAKELGTTRQTVSNKINKRTGFSEEEIIKWCQYLDIQQSEIGHVFFTI